MALIITGCTPYVALEGQKIDVEIAQSKDELRKGLMHEESLYDNCGMLFIFEESGKHGFWMKNTTIPIDMVFINSTNHVVDIIKADPCEGECQTYRPKDKCVYVLEVNQGTFNESVMGKKAKIKAR